MGRSLHKRNVNIVRVLLNRRTGIANLPHYWSTCIRCLTFSAKREAKCVWSRTSKKLITSENDKFFLDNFGTCYANFGRKGLPQALYSVKRFCGRSTVEDAVWIEAPLTFEAFASERPYSEDIAHLADDGETGVHCGLAHIDKQRLRNSIVLLLSNRHLLRLDLHRGDLLDDLTLPYGARVNWHYTEWNEWQESFAIKSCVVKPSQRDTARAAPPKGRDAVVATVRDGEPNFDDVAFMFALFDCVPFGALFTFSVDQSVFSDNKDVCDAGLRSNLLCVGTRRQNVLSIYDFSQVLRNQLHCDASAKASGDAKRTAHRANGTLAYYRMIAAPPCLLRVPYCSEFNLEFGGFPWSVRYTRSNQQDRVRLFVIGGPAASSVVDCDRRHSAARSHPSSSDLQGMRVQEVEHSLVINSNVSGEPESVGFFEDESGRVAHFAHDRLVLYKLQADQFENSADCPFYAKKPYSTVMDSAASQTKIKEKTSVRLLQQLTIKREANATVAGSNCTTNGLRFIDDPSGNRSFITRSGRVVKLSQREHHDDDCDAKPRTLHCLEYDDDLQSIICLFSDYRKGPNACDTYDQWHPHSDLSSRSRLTSSLPSANCSDEQPVFVAAFYDSLTGLLEREFVVVMPLEVQREPDLYSHTFSFFAETLSLTHVMRHCAAGNNLIRIYRLSEDFC